MKKTLLIFLCIVASNLFADDTAGKIEKFWAYVSKNETILFETNKEGAQIYNDLFDQIQLINENVYVMLANDPVNRKKDMIITAGGNPEFFDLCDRIVAGAPKFRQLNPISLFPKVEVIEPFTYYGVTLQPEDVQVHFDDTRPEIEIMFLLPEVYLAQIRPDESGQTYYIFLQILFSMTQQILGERRFGEKIAGGWISLANVVTPGIPLLELNEYLK